MRAEILRLAIPAFAALLAEPLFLLVDSAIIGHLGVDQLAGLGVAASLLATAASLFVFLAYGTTSVVARAIGAQHPREAVSAGVDGLWLALLLGAGSGALAWTFAEAACRALGATGDVLGYATDYLRISALGIPGMLVVMAVTGVLRGFQDTRTPLVVAVVGFSVNGALNAWFVYGLGLGVSGSAWGTVIAQTGMGAALTVALLRLAASHRAPLAFHPGRVLAAARGGVPLLIRTAALRGVLLLTVWAAAAMGPTVLAAHQVAATVWSFLTFTLDALAIAAQALTGKALGAGDLPRVREATDLMVRWGVGSGAVLGLVVVAASPWLPMLFTGDPQVRAATTAALIVVGLGQVVSGYVFVLDGVLIGAGDGPWLARAMVAVLAVYLPIVVVVRVAAPALVERGPAFGVVVLWLTFTGFMLLRGVALGWRARGESWMVTGMR